MKAFSLLLTCVMTPMVAVAQQPPPYPGTPPMAQQPSAPPPASASVAMAYALIAPDLDGQQVRTDISSAGDSLLLRVTPVNVEGERQQRGRRPASDIALEVRITKDTAGDVTRLTVTGAVTPRQRIAVSESATEAGRTNALRGARFGPTRAADVKTMARARAAIDTPLSDASLVWRRVGVQHEAVWEVRMPLPTSRGRGEYIARFSAGDGTLVELERVTGSQPEVVR